MQNNSRGIEFVKQRRKENAEKGLKDIQAFMKELTSSGGGKKQRGSGILGIAPLNFTTIRERTDALLENAGQNQDTLTENRTIIDNIQASRRESASQVSTGRTEKILEDDSPLHQEKLDAEPSGVADRQGGSQKQANQPPNLIDETDFQVEQREARQYLLFGMIPSRPGSATPKNAGRPFSAPAGSSRLLRPQSSSSSAAGTGPTARPGSAMQRPASSSGGWQLPPSRPTSSKSMSSRIKAMQDNAQLNKKTLDSNRDGLEVVKRRRAAAAQAMAETLAALSSAPESKAVVTSH
jgi:hypothetical protein